MSERSFQTGVIIVDHGSRRTASNEMLQTAVERFANDSEYSIVEPAHMELASPDIADAFARCVARGADRVVVFPYFLSPGRHWTEDIPRLTADAAASFPHIEWLVTAPFGLHPGMSAIISDRIRQCVAAAESDAESATDCDVCPATDSCEFATGGKASDDSQN